MASEKYSNDASTTLSSTINNSVGSLSVASASAFPASGNFRIRVEDEYMLVTAVSGTTFTVTRGIESSTAASHNAGVNVVQVMTKGGLDTIFADNFQYGACASLPAAERAGRVYLGSDFPMMYRDNGSSWQAFYNNVPVSVPVTGDYSWAHGGATATNTDVTNGPSLLSVTSTGVADKISTFLKNYSAPYTYTVLLKPMLTISVTFLGICVSDNTKFAGVGVILDSGISRIWTPKYNTKTSYSGEYFRYDPPIDYGNLWMQIEDDNTNLHYRLSADGVNFFEIYEVARTDFLTPTKIGPWIGTNAASGAIAKALWVADN